MNSFADESFSYQENMPFDNHPKGCSCRVCRAFNKRSILDELNFEIDSNLINEKYGIEDFTSRARESDCSRRRKFRCRSGSRNLNDIDSICLHQTSGSISTHENNFLAIPIHYVVLSNGRILQLYQETDYINHAGAGKNKKTGKPNNTFNAWSVGIEFAGTFANHHGKCWWNRSTKYVREGYKVGKRICGQPTYPQIDAGRRLIRAIIEKAPSVRFIVAHRQGDSRRENDPGPTIWLQIAEWAKRNLIIYDIDDYTEYTGKPIPDYWRRGKLWPDGLYGPGY